MAATGVGACRPSTPRSRWTAAAVCIALLASLLAIAPAPEARAATVVPGIDVSKWQGNVNWTTVGSTSTRFVIMRSTIGNLPGQPLAMDPKYLEYLAGATANGLIVGAYHRANVGLAVDDAKTEADYFVDHARIEGGDILPVLDIEKDHGLSPDQMVDWVRTWAQRVLARTGVHPMLYSSPYFWTVRMGNSTWFADHGYPLWIAHWGVTSPTVPAGNWSGHGYRFWQWTSKGSVAGIAGAVDRDRFNGGNLRHGRIASITVTPRPGGRVTGPRISCGGAASTCSRLADPDSIVTLTAVPVQGATLMRWAGACASAGSAPTCDVTALGAKTVSAVFGFPLGVERLGSGAGSVTSSPAGVSCGASCTATFAAGSTIDLTATPSSASAFTGWSGGCSGLAPTCSVMISAPTTVAAMFSSKVSVEENGTGTAFGWGKAALAGAIGGSYRWERRAGATISFPFTGRAVTLFTVSGPAMGKGRVSIDGNVAQTFDGYASATATSVTHRFAGLGAGAHVLSVRVLGTKRPASAGTRVAVDALRWGGNTVADPPGASTWSSVANAAASGGTYAVSDVRDAFARLRFQGTGSSARVRRGPGMGRAEIWADGALVRVVDLYAPTPGYATIALVAGLQDRWHTVRIVVDGSHRSTSTGSTVAIDRWVVF
jgi:GH25 family lysozyme M1 (1,4-beta-N-acetylmuramidase)